MKKELNLQHKTCIPCSVGTPPLTMEQINMLLPGIDAQWRVIDNVKIERNFKFRNFMQAMDFAQKIAHVAEQEGHHPELLIGWGKCIVTLWTHKINGLSESDFIMAAKIDALYNQITQ